MSDPAMPPLPARFGVDRHVPTGVSIYRHTPDQIYAYARAYADAQVAELVAVLNRINDWCCYATEEDTSARLLALQQIGQAARDALAKHQKDKTA